MKIECEITSAERSGDSLHIGLKGKPPNAADWRPNGSQTITVPLTDGAAKAFYVGRKVSLTVQTR